MLYTQSLHKEPYIIWLEEINKPHYLFFSQTVLQYLTAGEWSLYSPLSVQAALAHKATPNLLV